MENKPINYQAISMYILAVIVIMVIFIAIWSVPEVNDFVKGVSTLVLGRFLGYLDQIYNFEFGSTKTSRQKDETIANLSGGKS